MASPVGKGFHHAVQYIVFFAYAAAKIQANSDHKTREREKTGKRLTRIGGKAAGSGR